ncbi:MAG: hypothetical protein AMXMBFR64_37470 [Myxococcales bacterium]
MLVPHQWLACLASALLLSPAAASAGDPAPSPATSDTLILFEDEPPTDEGGDTIHLDFGDDEPPAQSTVELLDTLFDGTFTSELTIDLRNETPWEHAVRFRNRLDLALSHELGAGFDVRIAGRMTWWVWSTSSGDARTSFEPDLRDTWLRWRFPGVLDVTVGTQVFAWGAADALSAVDRLNPVDRRDSITASLETPKIPLFAVTLAHSGGPELGLRFVWAPFFEADRQAVFGDDFSLLGPDPEGSPLAPSRAAMNALGAIDDSIVDEVQPILLSPSRPEHHHLDNSTIGARVTSTLGGVDLALSYIWGWERTPVIRIDPRLPSLTALLEPEPDPAALAEAFALFGQLQSGAVSFGDLYASHYERSHLVGFDLAAPMWDLTIKAEAAFSSARVVYDAAFESIVTPSVRAVVGLDYTWETTLVVTLEASWEHLLDVGDRDLFLTRRDDVQVAAVLALRLLEGDALQIQAAVLYGATQDDWIVVPEVTWRIADGWAVSAGARAFEGASGSRGGHFDANDEAYVLGRADF